MSRVGGLGYDPGEVPGEIAGTRALSTYLEGKRVFERQD
jgi:hypothetical protein